jgi:CheY-like chemotaxis protein
MHPQKQPYQPNISILVVDDSLPILNIVSRFLELIGCRISHATNAVEALQQATAIQPDLILLDTDLPDISGYDVCYTLKMIRDTRHIPVVFMTTHYEFLDQEKTLSRGGAGYLIKPFSIDELCACIETHLNWPYHWNRLTSGYSISHTGSPWQFYS